MLARSPRLTADTDDAHVLRTTKFDGTKLPLVVLTSRNHKRMYSALYTGRSGTQDLAAPDRKSASGFCEFERWRQDRTYCYDCSP
jgi:hypothetical protein